MRAICTIQIEEPNILQQRKMSQPTGTDKLYLGIFEGKSLEEIKLRASSCTCAEPQNIICEEIIERTGDPCIDVHPEASQYSWMINRTVMNRSHRTKGYVKKVSMHTDAKKNKEPCLIVKWEDQTTSKPYIRNIKEGMNGWLYITR